MTSNRAGLGLLLVVVTAVGFAAVAPRAHAAPPPTDRVLPEPTPHPTPIPAPTPTPTPSPSPAPTPTSSSPAPSVTPCVRTTFHTQLVEQACQTGGQPAAKDAMKAFVKDKHIASCNQCHAKLVPNYELKPDGLDQFQKAGGR